MKPILLVGGGTGGHIFPLVALGEELTARHIPFIFVGGRQGKEREIVGEYGWPFRAITAGKWRRYWSWLAAWQNFVDIGRNFRGFFEALTLLLRTHSRVIFSKGGYVALPMVLAAKLLGRRIIIHESDTVMGLTNRLSARVAGRVLTAFAPNLFSHHDDRYEQVGIPIRKTLRQAAKLKSPQKTRPLILVIGGIQGAQAINNLIRQSLPGLLPIADIIHITGDAEILLHKHLAEKLDRKFKGSYKPFSYITRELPYYYQSADLIVSRSSATTVAEAALFAKAMYLIPLPSSAGNHQLTNAKHLQAAGAAIMSEQQQLTDAKFTQTITSLLVDRVLLRNLGTRLSEYFNEQDAIDKIIGIINE
ncbi:MAG: UDP-N-acetylglucosamine--N-acetylmuramyl-(pentapeptide) pyrophosphoryl-undecaprenol N-acetylglucosamine transferase [Patescibacteria group bacterium]